MQNVCSSDDVNLFIQTLHDLADRSGPAILPYFRQAMSIENKSIRGSAAFDPVTPADRAAETAMVACLTERFPDHRILGEEFGEQGGNGELEWVLDPIDGTRAFVCGAPTWGTLIGLRTSDAAIVGMMDQPFTSERFWGGPSGSFARRAGGPVIRLLANQTRDSLSDALLSATTPDMFVAGNALEKFSAIRSAVRGTRFGLDCYAYCLLAGGTLDLVVESGLKPYDIVALIPIIQNAGGCVTTWTGGSALQGGDIVASANPRLHEAALAILG